MAVSTHRNFEQGFKIDNRLNADKKGVIQIWNMGVLNDEVEKCTSEPKLAYMIAHAFGAIWKLEWCPSGGIIEFEKNLISGSEKFKRIGLLAAACSNGNVYIYSICLPNVSNSNDAPLFYQTPVAALTISHDMENYDHATALSWTKEKGHKIIAAGFSSGFVAIWDLSTDSQLLKHLHSDMLCFHPKLVFKAHFTVISAVVVFPYMNASYIFTASTDRSMQYWRVDPRNGSVDAFPLNGNFGKTNCITSGTTNIHWMAALIALDEVFGFGRANASFITLRDLTYKSTIVLNSSTSIWDLSACDWTNGFCQVTDGGEISAIYPHQLMAYVDSSKKIKKTRLILGQCTVRKLHCDDESEVLEHIESKDKTSIITNKSNNEKNMNEMIDSNSKDLIKNVEGSGEIMVKNKTQCKKNSKNIDMSEYDQKGDTSWNENLSDVEDIASIVSNEDTSKNFIWKSSYKDIAKDYGIVFYDLPTNLQRKSYEGTELQNVIFPNYPLNALTRVAYNPNRKSHSFIAVGMNAGFVRVRYIGEKKQ